jgi:RNA polymerase sigma-70 factor (ECF subfamily)
MKYALEHAIRQLPEIYRTVILLRDVEELSTEDTAQILGVSEDTVKTRLHRARLSVRKQLDKFLRGDAVQSVQHG